MGSQWAAASFRASPPALPWGLSWVVRLQSASQGLLEAPSPPFTVPCGFHTLLCNILTFLKCASPEVPPSWLRGSVPCSGHVVPRVFGAFSPHRSHPAGTSLLVLGHVNHIKLLMKNQNLMFKMMQIILGTLVCI